MAEKILDSTRSGMTRNSSHLASMYGKDFLELVWENGQILVQGGSSNRTRKTPFCIGYSINPSRSEEATAEDTCITKRAKLSTLYSLLDYPAHRDSDLVSSLQNSHLSHDQDSCQNIDLQSSKSKNSGEFKDECANLRPVKDSNKLTGGAHQPATPGNSHLCTSSSKQCFPSAPLKKPRMDTSLTPATNSPKQDLGCDQRTGKVNFSNFLVPAVFLKSTYQGNSATRETRNTVLGKVEEIKVSKVRKAAVAATSSKAPDHSIVNESAKGSHVHSLTGFQEQTALTANDSNPVSLVARSEEPPPDEHSEAVGHNSAFRIHGSHDQYYTQTSSSAALRAKGNANTNFCNEPLIASSTCSLGASYDPNFHSRKHEDTDDSTYSSDNDEEPEEAVKETPAREGTRVKRSRNAETHNLSERKRRDNINKKMRTLKELIPNCNKMDKASMLDDAIEYLKTLKLQLQIMSMGSGLCMPLMMLPAAAHHINASHLPHLMGAGMCFRPGTGIPFTPPQFPIPPLPGITDNRLQMFGFPNQVPPLPVSHSPFIPMIVKPSTLTQPFMATGAATNMAEHLANFTQLTTQEVSVPKNSDPNAKDQCVTKQAPNQVSFHH